MVMSHAPNNLRYHRRMHQHNKPGIIIREGGVCILDCQSPSENEGGEGKIVSIRQTTPRSSSHASTEHARHQFESRGKSVPFFFQTGTCEQHVRRKRSMLGQLISYKTKRNALVIMLLFEKLCHKSIFKMQLILAPYFRLKL